MAMRSKLWGHLALLTGSRMGRRVRGHLMLMRSDATSISSSSSSAGAASCRRAGLVGRPFAAAVTGWDLGVWGSGNQVEAWGIGRASFSGLQASWTIFLKPT